MSGVLVVILLWVTVVQRCAACEGSSSCTVVLGVLFCVHITCPQKGKEGDAWK